MLKGQDIVVALVLVDHPGAAYAALGARVGLSPSAVHRAMSRLGASGLVDPARRHVVRAHLVEFLVHGARYVFPAAAGASARGIACGVSVLAEGGAAPEWVWADPIARTTRPRSRLHASALVASAGAPAVHRRLVAVDIMRAGSPDARRVAAAWLRAQLG